jgi:hypothetical protein
VIPVLFGAAIALAVVNAKHPGSAGEATGAASDAVVNEIHSVAAPVDQAIVEAGPLVADARTSFQQSGLTDMLSGATTATTAAGGLSAPSQPSTGAGN